MVAHSKDEMPLFRFVKSDEALTNSTSGLLWLRTFSYFAKIEDPERRDEREGIASGELKGGTRIDWVTEKNMASPHYILSFTECECPPRNWGHHRLKLSDQKAFKQQIKDNMHRCHVFFDKVEYSDETAYESRPAGIDMWNRASLTKPTRYASEKEWRLVLVLTNLRIINDPLKIDVGILSGVLDYYPMRQKPRG